MIEDAKHDRSAGWLSAIRRALPYALTAAFLAVVAAVTARHEMWRDEAQAWLLARDAASPLALLRAMKYEGHPGLWHLILWPLAHLSWNPAWMQAAHVAIAAGAAFILLRFAPFSWPVKILLLGGYYFAYEWGVIARNYAVGVALLFGFCALYEQRWLRFPILGVLLFLLCHASIYTLLIVIVLLPTLAIEFAVSYAVRCRGAERCLGRFLLGLAIGACGVYAGIRQVAPPPDTGFAAAWHWRWSPERMQSVAGAVPNAYLPVPVAQAEFWNTCRFLEEPAGEGGAFWIPPKERAGFVFIALAAGSLFFLKRPWLIVPYWLGTFALLAFFYVKYPGAHRHHGHLWLLFVALLWMSYGYRPWRLPWRAVDWLPDFWDRHRMKALLPLLAVHVWGAWVAARTDWQEPFTQAKAAAARIRTEFPDRSRVFFAGEGAPQATAVASYLGLERVFYPDRDQFGSYMIWDNRRGSVDPRTMLARIARVRARTGKDAVLILSQPLAESRVKAGGIEWLASFEGNEAVCERYYLYRWPAGLKADDRR